MLGRQGWLFSSSDCWAGYDHSMFTTPSFTEVIFKQKARAAKTKLDNVLEEQWLCQEMGREACWRPLTFNVQPHLTSLPKRRLTSPKITSSWWNIEIIYCSSLIIMTTSQEWSKSGRGENPSEDIRCSFIVRTFYHDSQGKRHLARAMTFDWDLLSAPGTFVKMWRNSTTWYDHVWPAFNELSVLQIFRLYR